MDTLLDHLCRFPVRAARDWILGVFLGSMVTASVRSPEGFRYCLVSEPPGGFASRAVLRPSTRYSVSARACHFSVPPSCRVRVLEC